MRRVLKLTILFQIFFVALVSAAPKKTRILFIPLDTRPPCLKLTEKMGLIGNADVIAPPMSMLGTFHEPGQSDQINEWILQQDLTTYDAAIVVMDMVAYGGLVASRKHLIEESIALKRLEVLKQMKKKAPKLVIYGQNVIMRLAPSADGKNEAYREKLHSWAKLSPYTNAKQEVAQLEKEIPKWALDDYKKARKRNLMVNLKAIDFVKKGYVDYLILSQDDATPKGVHVTDRESLIATTKKAGLTDKIAVQPGADEVSMLLLARALNQHQHYSPKIKAVYSSEKLEKTVMPFEDRPLNVTVSHHIKATGSQEVTSEQEADLLFYVFPSRHEAGVAEKFADEIEQKINQGKKVIVADVDPIGNVQGGDTGFTKALENRHLFQKLTGYASWNTAGNTIGTALPHDVVYHLAEVKLLSNPLLRLDIYTAQAWFMINRVMDDYYYHNLVRTKVNSYLTGKPVGGSVLMSDADNKKVEAYGLGLLQEYLKEFVDSYYAPPSNFVKCTQPSELSFKLPWNRAFEADIDFKVDCN